MSQPPFNPLQELAQDISGITHRANERLRKWMEHHNEAYEREECPVGGCNYPSCSSFPFDRPVEAIKKAIRPRSNEIKSWGESIVWEESKDYLLECKIDWNIVRERMNVWMVDTQNPECHNVFFAYNEAVCEALAREDCPTTVDDRLVKYHNLGDGWHGFSYPKENDDHIPETKKMLLDKAWEWLIDHDEFGVEEFEFGRSLSHKRGEVKIKESDVFVKFKVAQI